MDLVRDIFLVLHLLGMAAVVGGFLAQLKATRRTVGAATLHGALTALVTGLVLVGLAYAGDWDPTASFHAKIAVKLLVTVAITVLAWRRRRAEAITTGEWGAIGGLAVLNVLVAVLWPV